jgi:glycosyltransferase involved in cell wall biosynthesis
MIWMITADFYPGIGGGERQAQRLAKSLIADGLAVRVVARRHGFKHLIGVPSEEEVDGIPVKRIFSRGPGKIGSAFFLLFGIAYLLLHGGSDIYHAHDVGAPAWIAVIARYLLGGKCLVKFRTGVATYKKIILQGFSVGNSTCCCTWLINCL